MRPRLYTHGLLAAVCVFSFCVSARAQETNSVSVISGKSRVVLVRDATAVSGFKVDDVKARAMVTTGIKTLTGEKDEATAWRHFVSGNDVVGIKINAQSGPLQSTRRVVVEAIAQGLLAAGASGTNIFIFDRDPLQMRAAVT